MESSFAFSCLWICIIFYASTSNGCPEVPVVKNAEVAASSKKSQYSDGDTIDYICGHGYVSLIKIIYTCNKNKWVKLRGQECSLKRCESPEDIPNGHYIIESGRSFVFGTTIKYICNEGYQIMSRFDTRTCRDGGWDNQLPACEEVSCERKTVKGNIKVEGLPDDPEDLIRHGHRLTFSCADDSLMLQGAKEITCLSNGEWSSSLPECVEVSCERKTVEGNIRVKGLPDNPEDLMRFGHRLTFTCDDDSLMLRGNKEITCLSNGEWSSSLPECVEAACKEEQLINVDILTGYPGIAPPYKPGHILVFRCTDVKLKMQGQRTIECLPDGTWDHPFPKCEATKVTCERENPTTVDILTGHPGIDPPYKPGHVLVLRCTDVTRKMQGQRTIECLSDGKWDYSYPTCGNSRCVAPRDQHVLRPTENFKGEMRLGAKRSYRCESGYEKTATEAICTPDGWTPKPLCTGTRCDAPLDQHVLRPTEYFRGVYRLGERRSYSCEPGYEQTASEALCTRDGWRPNPLCAVITVSGKCGPPPQKINADTVEMTKKEYNTGERVEYICFNKFTLEDQYPFTSHLTCQQGQWIGDIKCLKPCTVTKEIMDARGIELAYTGQQKMFAPHNDHITFQCLWGKISVGIVFRQKCNDGEMTLPQCVGQLE